MKKIKFVVATSIFVLNALFCANGFSQSDTATVQSILQKQLLYYFQKQNLILSDAERDSKKVETDDKKITCKRKVKKIIEKDDKKRSKITEEYLLLPESLQTEKISSFKKVTVSSNRIGTVFFTDNDTAFSDFSKIEKKFKINENQKLPVFENADLFYVDDEQNWGKANIKTEKTIDIILDNEVNAGYQKYINGKIKNYFSSNNTTKSNFNYAAGHFVNRLSDKFNSKDFELLYRTWKILSEDTSSTNRYYYISEFDGFCHYSSARTTSSKSNNFESDIKGEGILPFINYRANNELKIITKNDNLVGEKDYSFYIKSLQYNEIPDAEAIIEEWNRYKNYRTQTVMDEKVISKSQTVHYKVTFGPIPAGYTLTDITNNLLAFEVTGYKNSEKENILDFIKVDTAKMQIKGNYIDFVLPIKIKDDFFSTSSHNNIDMLNFTAKIFYRDIVKNKQLAHTYPPEKLQIIMSPYLEITRMAEYKANERKFEFELECKNLQDKESVYSRDSYKIDSVYTNENSNECQNFAAYLNGKAENMISRVENNKFYFLVKIDKTDEEMKSYFGNNKEHRKHSIIFKLKFNTKIGEATNLYSRYVEINFDAQPNWLKDSKSELLDKLKKELHNIYYYSDFCDNKEIDNIYVSKNFELLIEDSCRTKKYPLIDNFLLDTNFCYDFRGETYYFLKSDTREERKKTFEDIMQELYKICEDENNIMR